MAREFGSGVEQGLGDDLDIPHRRPRYLPIKFDGYRVQLHIANDTIKILTRRGHDWTKRFRKIAGDAFLINCGSAIVDGEVVVVPVGAGP
jgi:bifunctional non-homologous end joining protein LigD